MPDSEETNNLDKKIPRVERGISDNGKTKSQINAEYFQSLEQWLKDVRSYRYLSNFFPGFSYTMMTSQMNGFPSFESPNSNAAPPIFPFTRGFGAVMFPNEQQQSGQNEGIGYYKIPPLWKRVLAETLDFIILFIMKFTITFIAVDFFSFVDLRRYENFEQLDLKAILDVTSEITFLELAYRLIVCIYEGVFLRKGLQNQIGGSTPGKALMRIKVVLCNNIEQVQNQPNIVKVIPATDLGLGWSFARALLKNLVLALLLPICFPFFFNKFNRTTYDILCHSIVVEEEPESIRNG